MRRFFPLLLVIPVLLAAAAGWPQEEPAKKPQEKPATEPAKKADKKPGGKSKLVPVKVKLPKPMFIGTPKNLRVLNLEKPRKGPRKPILAPKGVKNVAKGKPVSGSDEDPIIGDLDLITDGDNSGKDGTYVDLTFGTQWVQIDLEARHELWAILVWHFHQEGRVYHDVVVKIADDEDFITNVRTVFNNDDDNSSGQGVGKGRPYLETHEGKLLRLNGLKARYIRLYSRGNTSNEQNHYVEVEVYGKPAP